MGIKEISGQQNGLLKTKHGYRVIPAFLVVLLLFTACAPLSTTPTSTAVVSASATPQRSITPPDQEASRPDLPAPGTVLTLETVDQGLRVYPGPVHYEGDLLTFEINLGEFVEPGDSPVTFQVGDRAPVRVPGEWKGSHLLAQLDTTGLTGNYQLSVRGEHDGVTVDEAYSLQIQPASQRPEQEEDPAWMTREVPCCTLHYIAGTAAARDIDWIARTVQGAAEDFDEFPTVDITQQIDVYFIDRMWFNGAFAGDGELLIVYTDRYYGPSRGKEGLEILVRHEMGHAVFPIFSYGEGLSVYLAGGHYKPEPIPRRAAAMLELDYFLPESGPVSQHEIVYLHQAAIVNYIIEAYGWQELRAYIQADSEVSNPDPGRRDEIFREAMGISWSAFQESFVDWLRGKEPGRQIRDLALTVELQELRRAYQEKYAPWPRFLLGSAEEAFARPEYLRVNIREPRTPAHVVAELLIANAQQAVNDGQYDRAAGLVRVIENIVTSGRLDEPLAREYGDVVLTLARQGYETVSLDLEGNEAHATVTLSPPELESLTLHKVGGTWQMGPAPEDMQMSPTPFPTSMPATPSPTSSLGTPTPRAAAGTDLPQGTLYYEDFSDPDSGWETHDELKLSYGYEDGSYRIFIDLPGGTYWFDSGEVYSDIAVETRVTLQAGPENNRFGLYCRGESGGLVQFVIDGEGRFGILWSKEGLPSYLGMDGMQESDVLRPAGEPNVLRAVCDGQTLRFFANGEELMSTEDTESSGSGETGITVSTLGGAGLDVVYDYLLVTEP